MASGLFCLIALQQTAVGFVVDAKPASSALHKREGARMHLAVQDLANDHRRELVSTVENSFDKNTCFYVNLC